jgi:hypothetical protein
MITSDQLLLDLFCKDESKTVSFLSNFQLFLSNFQLLVNALYALYSFIL